jgi:hypothetical protein
MAIHPQNVHYRSISEHSKNDGAAEGDKPMADLEAQEWELKDTRQKVRNLQVMQMRPGQTAEQLKHLADLEGSARAEVKLRVKALAHARRQNNRPGSKPTDA